MKATRIIYIDCVPSTRTLDTYVLYNVVDVRNLFVRFVGILSPPNIILDCTSLTRPGFNALLKFIEDYRGGITMLAKDPVMSTILSRFVKIYKDFEPEGGNLIQLRFGRVTSTLHQKLNFLFGFHDA